jgi:UDP-N-acetylglucosamine--N-acetylmuramyl-(pentapeptide) pyrophosphoryl-undecaprenol N-acetylglucosamine transferase
VTAYLLAGGGTAGHVNPLLAVADRIRDTQPDARVLVLGTAEGLESRLVPQRGYELLVVPRLPFPRRPGADAARFPGRWRASIARTRGYLDEHGVDAVVGFGGYASAPAYAAARRARLPIVVHEQNARPGIANRLGAASTRHVGVTFPGTPLRGAVVTGMPLRREIVALDPVAARAEAAELFGLDPARRTLLVTGGSSGARSINATVGAAAAELVATGWQVLHITGERSELADPGIDGYRMLRYCDRMELALGAADLAVSRSGATTVCELGAVGVPAVYVPYPVGNGEQRLNARGAVASGAALLVDDAAFTPELVTSTLVPLLGDADRLAAMTAAARGGAIRDGADRVLALVDRALGRRVA